MREVSNDQVPSRGEAAVSVARVSSDDPGAAAAVSENVSAATDDSNTAFDRDVISSLHVRDAGKVIHQAGVFMPRDALIYSTVVRRVFVLSDIGLPIGSKLRKYLGKVVDQVGLTVLIHSAHASLST